MRRAAIAMLLTACGPAAAPPAVAPAIAVEARVQPPSLAPFAGRYRLSGRAIDEGCGGEIELAANEIEIEADTRALHADVVERDYRADVEGDRLVADGRFDVERGCPESTVYERWELARAPDGALEGELLSTWLIWPSCMDVCTVRFSVRADPL